MVSSSCLRTTTSEVAMGSEKQEMLDKWGKQTCSECSNFDAVNLMCTVCGDPVTPDDNCGSTDMSQNWFEFKD